MSFSFNFFDAGADAAKPVDACEPKDDVFRDNHPAVEFHMPTDIETPSYKDPIAIDAELTMFKSASVAPKVTARV